MTQMMASPERAAFYDDSAVLTQDEALSKFDSWWAGDLVTSDMVSVGLIEPTLEEQLLLESRRMTRDGYGELTQGSNLHLATQALGATLIALVQRDMERGGLEGELSTTMRAGNYIDRTHRELWHSDNFRHPSVRWTAAWGIGSTRGARGYISNSDVLSVGDLHPGIAVEQGSILEPIMQPEGTVLRFMNTADIHAGPIGDGGRIMAQATLRLTR
jgi:hypothetical protein